MRRSGSGFSNFLGCNFMFPRLMRIVRRVVPIGGRMPPTIAEECTASGIEVREIVDVNDAAVAEVDADARAVGVEQGASDLAIQRGGAPGDRLATLVRLAPVERGQGEVGGGKRGVGDGEHVGGCSVMPVWKMPTGKMAVLKRVGDWEDGLMDSDGLMEDAGAFSTER